MGHADHVDLPGDTPADEGDRSRHALAINLRRARLARGLSLRGLADLTGTSKALISQIERAEANPTISVIGRLAAALDHSITDLLRDAAQAPVIVRAEHTRLDLRTPSVKTLFASLERRRFELAEGVIPANTASTKSSHGAGSVEFAVIVDGSVTVRSNGWEVELGAGDAIRFSAEYEHVYAAGDRAVRVITIVSLDGD